MLAARVVQRPQNLLFHFFHALRGVHIVKQAQPSVIRNQWLGLLLVRPQPRPYNFFPVVRPLLELPAVTIAASFDLRRALEKIVNLAPRLARPPAGDAPENERRIDQQVNHERPPIPMLLQQLAQILRLSDGSRESGTSSPRSIIGLAFTPSGVPLATCSRSMSPVERCGTEYLAASFFACVPFPAPGGPRKIPARLSSSAGRFSGTTGLVAMLVTAGRATGPFEQILRNSASPAALPAAGRCPWPRQRRSKATCRRNKTARPNLLETTPGSGDRTRNRCPSRCGRGECPRSSIPAANKRSQDKPLR